MKWTRGQNTINQLLAENRLEPVTDAAADANPWLESATALLESARREQSANPEAAYVLAYDAARKAATALLIQQGLRPKTTGHHVTVEQVVRAQFGGPFNHFGLLRRRRAEIEYPQHPGDHIQPAEATQAITHATDILQAARALQPQLAIYR